MRLALTAALCALNTGCFFMGPGPTCKPVTGQPITGAISADLVGSWEDDATILEARFLEFRSDGTVSQTEPSGSQSSSPNFSSRTGTWQAVAAPTEIVKTATGTQTLDDLVNDPRSTSAGPLSAGVLTVTWSDGSVQRGAIYTSSSKLGPAGSDTHLTDDVPVYGGYRRVECDAAVAR